MILGVLFLVLVGLLVWGVVNPAVGRSFARIFAVVAMGLGTGFLIWGIVGASGGERLRTPFGIDVIVEPIEAIACGAGLLAASIVSLVLSFVGSSKRAIPQERKHDQSPSSSG